MSGNLVCLMHNVIIYANEVGQPGEQLTETTVGSFPTRGSICDNNVLLQVLWVIMLSENGRLRIGCFIFYYHHMETRCSIKLIKKLKVRRISQKTQNSGLLFPFQVRVRH